MVNLNARRGTSKLGCLLMLAIVGAAGYFGIAGGKEFWKYYALRDAMQSQARFAASRSDSAIADRLKSLVDSLGLPESAKNLHIKRANNVIYIWTEYYVQIEMPGYVKELNFSPRAQSPF